MEHERRWQKWRDEDTIIKSYILDDKIHVRQDFVSCSLVTYKNVTNKADIKKSIYIFIQRMLKWTM